MRNTIQTHHHLKSAYFFISAIVFAPVLLWPAPMILYNNPMLGGVILPKWHLSIIIMLLTCVAIDTMLYPIQNFAQALQATLWISLFSIFILQNQHNTWFLAVLCLIHSLRSGWRLWQHKEHSSWWLQLAWARDLAAALVVFVWLSVFQHTS